MKTNTSALFFLLLALCKNIVAGDELAKFETGVNSLCIGNSFFIHMYEEMNILVDPNKYPDHGQERVFRGGVSGSPQNLWAKEKKKVISYLKPGKIDLLMMTIHYGTVVHDYVNWIELAKSYNPRTAFFIGIPWAPNGATETTSAYNAMIEKFDEPTFAIAEELRDLYPDTPIYYLNYGHIAARMKVLFDEGALEDIQQLCCSAEDSMFRDLTPGHQGDMLRDVAALYWLRFFYGDTTVTLPNYNTHDVDDIIAYAQTKNIDRNKQTLVSSTISG